MSDNKKPGREKKDSGMSKLRALMFHGTVASFNEFDASYLSAGGAYGAGFYFTNNEPLARTYSDGADPVRAYLSLKNPWVVDLDDYYDMESRRVFRQKGARERLMHSGYDGVIVRRAGIARLSCTRLSRLGS